VTVYAVLCFSSLFGTIGGNWSSSQRSPGSDIQIYPLERTICRLNLPSEIWNIDEEKRARSMLDEPSHFLGSYVVRSDNEIAFVLS